MKYILCAGLLTLISPAAFAQMASHAPAAANAVPTGKAPTVAAHVPTRAMPGELPLEVSGKPVAKVNGAILTDRDLIREMYAMFPYAQQHNGGFPKDMEPQIRKGALQMIIFEELVYQEGKRRGVTIPPERIARAMQDFRKQFPNEAAYQEFLKYELRGSQTELRNDIRRSFIIESVLKTEVTNKAAITTAEARAYYVKYPMKFQQSETYRFQSISIIPPNQSSDNVKEAKNRGEQALKEANGAKTYRDFGLLAEKFSDDDFHVKMGDHQVVEAAKLPPPILKVLGGLKPDQVSDLVQLGSAYTIVRLVSHKPAGKVPFDEIKAQLQTELQKERTERLRSALGKQLRSKAKIETM